MNPDNVRIIKAALAEFINRRINWGHAPFEEETRPEDVSMYVDKVYIHGGAEWKEYKREDVAGRVNQAVAAWLSLSGN